MVLQGLIRWVITLLLHLESINLGLAYLLLFNLSVYFLIGLESAFGFNISCCLAFISCVLGFYLRLMNDIDEMKYDFGYTLFQMDSMMILTCRYTLAINS